MNEHMFHHAVEYGWRYMNHRIECDGVEKWTECVEDYFRFRVMLSEASCPMFDIADALDTPVPCEMEEELYDIATEEAWEVLRKALRE